MAASTQSGGGIMGPYELDYLVGVLAVHPNSKDGSELRLACGSFIPEDMNYLDVLAVNTQSGELQCTARLPHYFPVTRACWLEKVPGALSSGPASDLIMTSGDMVRIWSADGDLRQLLRHEENPHDYCTPITGVDCLGASTAASCDSYGQCALWDLETGTMVQAWSLMQPLSDVSAGPGASLIAAAGEQGDCFLLDTRQPQKDVHVFSTKTLVRGTGRVAWGRNNGSVFAAAWQGEQDCCIALYNTKPEALHQTGNPQLLRAVGFGAPVADMQWSPVFPELLCCAAEDGNVEVWELPQDRLDSVAAPAGPAARWQPKRGEACTALALSHEVRPREHAMAVATIGGSGEAARKGKLWLAKMPEPAGRQRPSPAVSLPAAPCPLAPQIPAELSRPPAAWEAPAGAGHTGSFGGGGGGGGAGTGSFASAPAPAAAAVPASTSSASFGGCGGCSFGAPSAAAAAPAPAAAAAPSNPSNASFGGCGWPSALPGSCGGGGGGCSFGAAGAAAGAGVGWGAAAASVVGQAPPTSFAASARPAAQPPASGAGLGPCGLGAGLPGGAGGAASLFMPPPGPGVRLGGAQGVGAAALFGPPPGSHLMTAPA